MGYIKKKIIKEANETIEEECDVCKKRIPYSKNTKDKTMVVIAADHHDYDEDNRDSIIVCSYKCYLKGIFDFYNSYKKYETAEIDDKQIWFIKEMLLQSGFINEEDDVDIEEKL